MSFETRIVALSAIALVLASCGENSTEPQSLNENVETTPIEVSTASDAAESVNEPEKTESNVPKNKVVAEEIEAVSPRSFTETDVQNFLKAVKDLDEIESRYPDIDLGFDANAPGTIHELIDEDGNLNVFAHAIGTMKNKDAKEEIVQAVRTHGFKDGQSFAVKADAIMMAFISVNIDEEELNAIKSMTPERLAKMPSDMRGQYQAALRMLKAAQGVSKEDRQTIRPYASQIAKAF